MLAIFYRRTDSNSQRRTLMGLNRATAPWRIVDGKSESVDYIAEWKIVDSDRKG